MSGRASPLFPEGAAYQAAGTAAPCMSDAIAVVTFCCGHACLVCTAAVAWPLVSLYRYSTVFGRHLAHLMHAAEPPWEGGLAD